MEIHGKVVKREFLDFPKRIKHTIRKLVYSQHSQSLHVKRRCIYFYLLLFIFYFTPVYSCANGTLEKNLVCVYKIL